MAKKKPAWKRRTRQQLPENALPQNILPMGERVEEDKNIYLSQQVYREIHKFTRNKTTNESGGVLVGTVVEEFGKANILVNGFIEARYCEATPTTLKFTHETWEYIHKEMAKKFPGGKILGWIHTHPDFGIFLSEYDKFIHENFFSEHHQIAYVIDPIQNNEGFYFWVNGKIERCRGFYIFDRTGAKIDIGAEKETAAPLGGTDGLFSFRNVLLAVLSAAVVFLMFANMSQRTQIQRLQLQQETIVSSANQSLAYLQQQIAILQARLEAMEQADQSDNNETGSETARSDSAGDTGADDASADTDNGSETTTGTEEANEYQ